MTGYRLLVADDMWQVTCDRGHVTGDRLQALLGHRLTLQYTLFSFHLSKTSR